MLTVGKVEVPTFSRQDLRLLRRAVKRVIVPDSVLDCYLDVCAGLELSDRRVKQALAVVKASAIHSGRNRAQVSDIAQLATCCIIEGDNGSAKTFANALKPYQQAVAEEEARSNIVLINKRIVELHTLIKCSEDYSDAEDAAVELMSAKHALEFHKKPASLRLYTSGMTRAEEALALADKLYDESL